MVGKAVLQQLTAYKPGMQIADVKKKYNINHIVKLASNENPYGSSDKVLEALRSMDQDFALYPDGYAFELRMKLAERFQVHPDQLVLGAGSDEIITLICRAFLHDGTNTVMAHPTFPQYRHHALIEGAAVKTIDTVEGKHNLTGMAKAIDEQTKVVWICTPDNPTGTVITQADLDGWMEACPNDVVVVLDVAYMEYANEASQLKVQDNLKKYPNLIFLHTFSKIYGIAGLRVGYGIGTEKLIEKLNIVRGPFNTTSLSQRVALSILDDDEFIKETKAKNSQVRTEFEQFLDELGWKYYPSETNFLLVHTPIQATKAADYLLRHGFIVRSGDLLGYPYTVRITIGTKEDMAALQLIIKKLDKEIRGGVIE